MEESRDVNILLPLITLLLGFLLGILFYFFLFRKAPSQAPLPPKTSLTSSQNNKPNIDVSKLPISISLLTNPIVYEWRGSVKGKLTWKDEHSFTLVDEQGNSITITDIVPSGERWKTIFLEKTDKKEQKESSLSAIPVGSTLRGDFFIFKGGPNTPVGGLFVQQ